MARSFNGTTDAISARTISNLKQPCTLALWVYPTVAPSGTDQIVIANGNPASNGNNIDRGNTGVLGNHWFYTQSGLNFIDGGTTLSLNTWSHIAATDAVGAQLTYTNGSQTGTAAVGAFTAPTGANFTIGGNTHSMVGNVADVAAWTVVLTPREIFALSRGARPYQIRPGSLVGWWPLDGYGHAALDRSGYANNGTVTGTALVSGPPLVSAIPISTLKLKSFAGSSAVFRRTLSSLGTRAGSRQAVLS